MAARRVTAFSTTCAGTVSSMDREGACPIIHDGDRGVKGLHMGTNLFLSGIC